MRVFQSFGASVRGIRFRSLLQRALEFRSRAIEVLALGGSQVQLLKGVSRVELNPVDSI